MPTLPTPWIQSVTGRRLFILAPRASDIDLCDMAHALSGIGRFTLHTRGDRLYSVAQHSVLVASRVAALIPRHARLHLAALLHDGSEYVLGDMSSPLKAAMKLLGSTVYADLERRHQAVIAEWAGLESSAWLRLPVVKRADLELLATERRDLMLPTDADWDPMPDPLAYTIRPWTRERARDAFISEFHRLRELCGLEAARVSGAGYGEAA